MGIFQGQQPPLQSASKKPIPLQQPGISAMPPQLQLQLQLQQLELQKKQIEIELLKKTIEEQGLVLQKQKQLKPLTNDYIQIAGQLGITNLISYFEKNKMPTDQSDCFGRTLLHCAVNYNDPEPVNFLLAKHVDSHDYVNRRDMNGLTALHYAAHRGNIEAVKALLQVAEVNPNVPDKDGNTSLQYAARAGKIEAVKALLQAERVNPNEGDKYGINPLHYAAKNGNIEVVNALLQEERINPGAYDNQSMTPLHYASYNARFGVVEALNASYKAKGKKMDVNKTGNGEEGSLSGKKPMELVTLSTFSDYEKIRTMALLYKLGGKIEGEEFFINLDGNEWISKDLKENIKKLNSQKRESVDKFILEKDKAEDDKAYKEIKATKEIAPRPVVYPIEAGQVRKRALIEGGQQS